MKKIFAIIFMAFLLLSDCTQNTTSENCAIEYLNAVKRLDYDILNRHSICYMSLAKFKGCYVTARRLSLAVIAFYADKSSVSSSSS